MRRRGFFGTPPNLPRLGITFCDTRLPILSALSLNMKSVGKRSGRPKSLTTVSRGRQPAGLSGRNRNRLEARLPYQFNRDRYQHRGATCEMAFFVYTRRFVYG